jgi:hypothetical protein
MVNMLVSCEARQNSEKRKNKPHIHNVSWWNLVSTRCMHQLSD